MKDLNKITQELKDIKRRLGVIEDNQDRQHTDREILENVIGRLLSLEEQQKLTRQNDTENRKSIENKMDSVGKEIKSDVAEVQDTIESKKVIEVKPKKKWYQIWK